MSGHAHRRRILMRRAIAVGLLVAALALGLALALSGGAGPQAPADPLGARVETIDVASEAVGEKQPVSVVVPPGGSRGAGLLVFLHGRGDDERSLLRDAVFAGLKRLGAKAPVIAFPDGGDDSYWHDRRDGRWGRYVLDEVIPAVQRRFGTSRSRVAIGGISMGGFGALDLARSQPGRFCAVGAHSPAVWQSAGETAPGAFDDAEDFARHDLVAAARAGDLGEGSAPVWLDAGDRDPFLPGLQALAQALGVAARTSPGEHGHEYWDRHWGEYLRFYADALAACGGTA